MAFDPARLTVVIAVSSAFLAGCGDNCRGPQNQPVACNGGSGGGHGGFGGGESGSVGRGGFGGSGDGGGGHGGGAGE